MVKSYNKKGFGFIMLLDTENAQDLYYTRENLSPKLELRNIPGQNVTFEAHRFPDGKWAAVNIRPFGEDKADLYAARREAAAAGPAYFARQNAPYSVSLGINGGFSDRDAAGRPASANMQSRRNISPHAGSRAYKETLMAELGQRSANRTRSESPKRKRRRDQRSRSSESRKKKRSSDSSSESKKQRKKKKGKKRRKSSSSSSSSGCVIETDEAAPAKAADASGADSNLAIDKAKSRALEELLKLRDKQPLEARMSDFRALLRKWHPDKNPDNTEVATAVFQFLQKGKSMLDTR
jgi:curved DNA-binding protein CbpA